jgi:hypothetical protein
VSLPSGDVFDWIWSGRTPVTCSQTLASDVKQFK